MVRSLTLAALLLLGVLGCSRKEAAEQSRVEPASAMAAEARPAAKASELDPAKESKAARGLPFSARTIGGKKDDPLPWIVALHGLGDTPGAFIRLLGDAPVRAHVYAPQALYSYGDGYDWYRTRVDGDPEALSAAMHTAVLEVMRWIDAQQRDPKNVGKPIVTGFSQGGMLSFALAVEHPERFLAVIPISGTLPRPLWPTAGPTTRVPIFALHGAEDRVIALGPTEALVAHLAKVGHSATLDSFPGVAHRVPPEVRQRLYELLAQSLGQ